MERLARLKPDWVVHLAARSSVAASSAASFETMRANLGGALNLAQALHRTGQPTRFVFASSSEVYGTSFLAPEPLDESAPMRPANAYARSKAAAEWALRDMLSDVCPLAILRLFNHTGAGQDERFVLPSFAAQIARIEAGISAPAMRVGNLDAVRDFLDVEDVIEAYLHALTLPLENGAGSEVFNICSGTGQPIRALLEQMLSMARTEISVELDPARLRPSDIARAVGDPSRFKARTGWTPTTPIIDTLAALLAYWRNAVREPKH